eukprot:s13162_g1.t1
MDRFLVNPRPKPQPKPKPKPANLMEKVISIKHDESVVENPCLYTVAREWAARLGVTEMAASQMIVAFWQLPARPYEPQERPPPERVSLAEKALSSDPMQAWFESRDVFACSRKVAEKRCRRWPKLEDLSFELLGRTAIQVVHECVRPLRRYWRRRIYQVLGVCTHWTKSYQQKRDIINRVFASHAIESARKARLAKGGPLGGRPFFRAGCSNKSP